MLPGMRVHLCQTTLCGRTSLWKVWRLQNLTFRWNDGVCSFPLDIYLHQYSSIEQDFSACTSPLSVYESTVPTTQIAPLKSRTKHWVTSKLCRSERQTHERTEAFWLRDVWHGLSSLIGRARYASCPSLSLLHSRVSKRCCYSGLLCLPLSQWHAVISVS